MTDSMYQVIRDTVAALGDQYGARCTTRHHRATHYTPLEHHDISREDALDLVNAIVKNNPRAGKVYGFARGIRSRVRDGGPLIRLTSQAVNVLIRHAGY